MNRTMLFIFVLIIGYSTSRAQEKRFIPIPSVLDRFSQAIGGPNEAFASGAADVFVNPALMSSIPDGQIEFSNLINGYDLQYFSAALVWSVTKNQFLGMGIYGLDVPVGERYDNQVYTLRYDNTFYFNMNLSYAYSFAGLTVGGSIAYISSQIYPDDAYNRQTLLETGLGLYAEIIPNIKLGFMFKRVWRVSELYNIPISNSSGIGGSIAWTPLENFKDRIQILFSIKKNGGQKISFNYGVIFKPFAPTKLDKWGIKNISLRSGTSGNNLRYLNIPGKSSSFIEERNNKFIGVGIQFLPIYNIEFGLNYCYQFTDLPRNMTLLTTRVSF